MTERQFTVAYLMGRHNGLRLTGQKLWDVDFWSTEPTKLELDEAKAQYKAYQKHPQSFSQI